MRTSKRRKTSEALLLAGKHNQVFKVIQYFVVCIATSIDFLLQRTIAISLACNEQY